MLLGIVLLPALPAVAKVPPKHKNEMPTLGEDSPHPIPIPPLLRAKFLADVEDLFPLFGKLAWRGVQPVKMWGITMPRAPLLWVHMPCGSSFFWCLGLWDITLVAGLEPSGAVWATGALEWMCSFLQCPQPAPLSLLSFQGHCLLCVLLEAGGCASQAIGSPGPDCVYVDQARTTLQQLQPLEGRMDQQLAAAPHPALSCADGLLAGPHDTFTLIPSPVLRKLPGASRTLSPTPRRVHFADFPTKARRPSPSRDIGGPDGGGGVGGSGLSPQPTPEATRRLQSSEESGALLQVRPELPFPEDHAQQREPQQPKGVLG